MAYCPGLGQRGDLLGMIPWHTKQNPSRSRPSPGRVSRSRHKEQTSEMSQFVSYGVLQPA